MNRWVEESGMLGDVQGGFRKGRRTEDNIFIVERLIEMTRRRKACLFVAFIDMEKAYDRVDRKKLFEVLRAYGIHEKMVSLIERVYSGNMVKFELGNVVTKWCKSESGVRQGCPLSPLLFNLYIRELGMRIEEWQEGFKYTSVNSNGGELKRSNLAGLMYADDVCLFAESAESLQRVCDHVSTVSEEYGLKVSENKSKVVCINGIRGIRRWKIGSTNIDETEEYKYLGVTVKGGPNGGFKSMGDRMKEANGVLGMVKFAASRSGSKFAIGREGWKGMVVNKLMYGCGALVWSQTECNDLEVKQNKMGRWLWDVVNVKNELVRGETGWSTFEEREAKAMVSWLLRIVFSENRMADLGRACLLEIGCKSGWWARCRHICNKFGLKELVNLICLGDVSVNGVDKLGMSVNEKTWMKFADEKIKLVGCRTWMNNCGNSKRLQEYVFKKKLPMIEKYVDGSVGAMVRMMVRGGCLPVRGNTRMSWKYDDEHCVCGEVESEEHMLLDCNLYMDVRRRWKEKLASVNVDVYNVIKGYEAKNDCIERETMWYLGMVWKARQASELSRLG